MTPSVRALIAGNWKMHGTRAEASALAGAVRDGAEGLGCDLLLCPAFPHLGLVAGILGAGAVALGGQDCHPAAKGAHTGDVSAPMLSDIGARFVLLGHSERRANHAEGNGLIHAKAEAATIRQSCAAPPTVTTTHTVDSRNDVSQVAFERIAPVAGLLDATPCANGRCPKH